MFPPLACAASVVTELLVLVKDCPALIVMSPALPGPVLAAVMELPLFSVTDWPVVYDVAVMATAFNLPRSMFALMPVSSPSTIGSDSSSVVHSGFVSRNARTLGRDASRALPGDLLYFRQPGQRQPDHLMIVVGRSHFETEGSDWVVYHTGPSPGDPGEMRKVQLATLRQHPSARWRPVTDNPAFVGVFRLAALAAS